MKKTTIAALVIGLLALGGNAMAKNSALAAGTTTAKTAQTATAGAQKPATPPAPGNPGMRPPAGNGRGMAELLQLTEKQQSRIRDIEKKYSDQSTPDREQLRLMERDLAKESLNKTTDQKKITELTDAIGKQHTRLALTESRFLKEVSTVLTPEQIQVMLNMKDRSMPPAGPGKS
jgi:Spy/CpxP family protein refolding chaperone